MDEQDDGSDCMLLYFLHPTKSAAFQEGEEEDQGNVNGKQVIYLEDIFFVFNSTQGDEETHTHAH